MIAPALIVAFATAGLDFTREVNRLDNATLLLKLGPNCPDVDRWGTFSCNFAWGTNVTLDYSFHNDEVITAAYSLSVNFKINNLFNFSGKCPACGDECDLSVMGMAVKLHMPPCPITPHTAAGHTALQLPGTVPFPFSLLNSLVGSVRLLDPNAAVLDDLLLTATAASRRD
ncbi:MAG: hypothetical protein ACPGR8_13500 [Limisphaerales bacterium]